MLTSDCLNPQQQQDPKPRETDQKSNTAKPFHARDSQTDGNVFINPKNQTTYLEKQAPNNLSILPKTSSKLSQKNLVRTTTPILFNSARHNH
jgi:hypothetical protein